MKTLSFSLLFLVTAVYTNAQHKTHKPVTHHNAHAAVSSGASSSSLNSRRVAIDDYKFSHPSKQIFLVKLEGEKKLHKVKEGQWPDNTDYIYSILKDGEGRVTRIEQSPYSQSGDWYIGHTHYFDTAGRAFCFEKTETVFNDGVKGGLVMRVTLKYFNNAHHLISEKTTLTDKNSHPLKRKSSEFDFRNDEYTVYKSVDECLEAYHISASLLK